MASIQVKFRKSSVSGNTGSVYYLIIHNSKAKQLITPYRLFPDEWNNFMNKTTFSVKNSRKNIVASVIFATEIDLRRFSIISEDLTLKREKYTVDDIIDEYKMFVTKYSLSNYMGSLLNQMMQNYRFSTAQNYKTTLNSFCNFMQDRYPLLSPTIDYLTPDTIQGYETWLRLRGITPNTSSFYMRILRAVYNRAVDEQVIFNRNPFKHVYTGIDKTTKRALSLTLISKIKHLDLSYNHSLDMARDMFMMSFYLRGMSFIDMAYLKRTDNQDGYIVYRRRKTGQKLSIKWTDEMQRIIDKYPHNQSDYLLPILASRNCHNYNAYRNIGSRINRNLKIIARLVNLNQTLTLYVARHSWASAAQSKGIPLNVISQGMGHDSESTTRIYLNSLDTSLVDKANSVIIKSL
ncbi:MAG: site-specific integrase [Muribaculaceae bacterium]|nr:site-specific integrase [Muribaculaceae bacterium]MDE6642479.1 site-specific integrase [Muribaculaceae bacterium]MDE7092716.1 site-specific integrase [Muribaculaceae bacterium]